MERVVIVQGQDFAVTLTFEVVRKIQAGVGSDYSDKYLVSAAITHSFLKNLRGAAGDIYSVRPVLRGGPGGDKPGRGWGPTEYWMEGPTAKLSTSPKALLINYQPTTSNNPELIHIVYDLYNCCFITDNARCIYVSQDELDEAFHTLFD